jgi:hypothetical protein
MTGRASSRKQPGEQPNIGRGAHSRSRTAEGKATEQHPIGMLFPPASEEEYRGLVRSLEANGFLREFPIYTYQGKVLEGWSRHRACKKLGITPIYKEFTGDHDAALRFVCAANASRRHLTGKQKRKLAADILKSDPNMSDAEVARLSGISDKTVASVRKQMQSTSEIPRSNTRVGRDRRVRPATQPRRRSRNSAAQPSDRSAQASDHSQPFCQAASVPFMITHAMKAELRGRGFTDDQIRNMTPAQAHEAVRNQPPINPTDDPEQPSGCDLSAAGSPAVRPIDHNRTNACGPAPQLPDSRTEALKLLDQLGHGPKAWKLAVVRHMIALLTEPEPTPPQPEAAEERSRRDC